MFDIWPDINLKFNFLNSKKIEEVELLFEKKFINSFPVFLSSGRSAIVSCLLSLNLRRESKVAYSPFANACIFRTIGEIASPVPANLNTSFECHLVYHQWGYAQKTNLLTNIIEDSIDSLIVNKESLFPNNGEYEIISLSKLFGLPFGAIVFCKNIEFKNQLIEIRNQNKTISRIQYFLKYISKFSNITGSYWSHLETLNSWPGNFINDKIFEKFESYSKIIKDRQDKIDILDKNIFYNLTPGRLPIAIPLKLNYKQLMKIKNLGKFKFFERHINLSRNINIWDLTKCFPLPIHQEVPVDLINKIKKIINEH